MTHEQALNTVRVVAEDWLYDMSSDVEQDADYSTLSERERVRIERFQRVREAVLILKGEITPMHLLDAINTLESMLKECGDYAKRTILQISIYNLRQRLANAKEYVAVRVAGTDYYEVVDKATVVISSDFQLTKEKAEIIAMNLSTVYL